MNEVTLSDLNRIATNMRPADKHCLLMWAFIYVLIGDARSAIATTDKTHQYATAHIGSQCIEQAMRLLGEHYSSRWSLEAKQRVTGRVGAILNALVEYSADERLLWCPPHDVSSYAYSPVGCAQSANEGVYVENSGITL